MTTTTQPITIKATLSLIRSSNPSNRSPYQRYYECYGPDGTKFTNSSKATLLDVLRRRYKAKIVLVVEDHRAEQWKGDGNS